ncbi:Homoserine kinase [Lactobacillus equicursoris DSM 19284 = JCM 14600 = CIP 110162]|uniref:Homoserine kinase n=1 Tax=Lactobacillus equicursoris DSM 19284 = JCM 14600 = CIP 110162 TaxID=1293597 RepID=K0NJ98_9LACO|nr:homoserine kinase [Lactobacillus equicursoris]KRL01570.1 homoserine kinase [Lactobacillus equicursoris DSM 19284 = JCM 14600 = CIP 110162]CCK85317.1 Homoserine kinase [Lactobacillus equicursoris DSM 19284 = JCM 14600 = CIP 110162]
MQIKVPASSANLGPGFDSIGVAISLYLTIDVLEETDHWVVDHDLGDLPRDEKNMIVASALKIKPDLAPRHLRVESDIPLAHGLGSSSSAIVGGIELADKLGGMHLAPHEKIELASQLEGHPDNVAPTILGSLVVVCKVNGHFTAVKAPVPPFAMIAYIPAYNLKTSDARAVLPKELSFKDAVQASAVANTAVAALFAQDYEKAGELMEADLFHERYRSKLVPELEIIRNVGHSHGAVATYLSGAGPTVMSLVDPQHISDFIDAVREAGLKDEIRRLEVAPRGAYWL